MDGDRSGTEIKKNLRDQFEKWVSQYPMMWIQYKGRGVEFYGAEIPDDVRLDARTKGERFRCSKSASASIRTS